MRRLLYHPRYVEGYRVALMKARDDLHDLHRKHVCEMSDLRRQLDETRAVLSELRAAVRARQRAENALADLHAIQSAVAEKRDTPVTLH